MEPDTDGAHESDTIVAGESFDETPTDDRGDVPAAPIGEPRGVVAPNRVIGGVAADLASRLGVDPLWVRFAFVALIAFGGLGFVLYGGLWLVLIVGARPGWAPIRFVGAVALAIGWAVVFGEGSFLLDNAAITIALLAGVAIALWQPRGIPARAAPGPVTPGSSRPAWAAPSIEFRARERSRLGRWVLAFALLVAAGGALIDHYNGGRLHPEQWLGAAAAICGFGMVIAAFRGRAYWLAVPALVLGAAGFVAGHAARAGVSGDINVGEIEYYLGTGYDNLPPSDSVIAGTMRVHVDAAPAEQNRSELRMGLGVIYVNVAYGVSAEVRATLFDGDASIDGMLRPTPDGEVVVLRVGPEGEPDVVIDATVSHGNVRVTTGPSNDSYPTMATIPFAVTTTTLTSFVGDDTGERGIGEGFRMLRDGTVLFPPDARVDDAPGSPAASPTIITPDGVLSTNLATTERDDGTIEITVYTPEGPGEFLLLANGMIVTPGGVVIDIPAERGQLRAGPTATARPTSTIAPAETTEF